MTQLTLSVPPLATGELHVWSASVDLAPERGGELGRCLSADERERAARRRHELDRRRYIAGRGILRTLLAGYLNRDPAELCMTYGPQGKPELAEQSGAPPIRFNVSHSGPLALYAFSRGARIGVDLERLRPLRHAHRVAERVFPAADLRSWLSLPPEHRLAGFFNRWTRLEAVAKLHGGGVWWLVRRGGSRPGGHDVSVIDLSVAPGYRAAAAVDGPIAAVREMRYP
jgi:4'-phosphopantetheinyl transferase